MASQSTLKNPAPNLVTEPCLNAVLNSLGEVYFVVDGDHRLVMVNDAAEAFFSLPRGELVGRTLADLVPGAASSAFAPLLDRATSTGEAGRITAPSAVRPGRVVDFRATPLGDGVVGVAIIDVTEWFAAERAVLEHRDRLALAVGAHQIGIFDWHVPSGRILWSPELEAIFGLEPGSFEGTVEALGRQVLPGDLERAIAMVAAAKAEGLDLVKFNFRIRRTDGALRWIEGVARLLCDAEGGDRVVGTNVDVTERVLAEDAMRSSRERLDLAVGAHHIGIFDWDTASGSVTWSDEMEAIFGVEPGTFEGRLEDVRRRVLPADLAMVEAESSKVLGAGGDVTNFEYRIRRDDGAIRWIEAATRFIFSPDREIVRAVGTALDVTDRKVAEQHQRLLINELNHRVKNTLAIVQAIAWQSFRAGGVPEAAREAFEGRLAALAAAHDVLTHRNWEGGWIEQIVRGAVAPHDSGEGRITVEGPAVQLEPKTAVALALATHELATNAVKHGALSGTAGRVDVRWTVEKGLLRLTWRESGGPPVAPPTRLGFGGRLLKQGLADELGGSVWLDFRPEGLVCAMEAKLAG